MKLHKQFDINHNALKFKKFDDITRNMNEFPVLVEKLIKGLLEKGYDVAKGGVYLTGIPQNITVIKEITSPFVTQFSEKAKEDFDAVSRALGIEKLFE